MLRIKKLNDSLGKKVYTDNGDFFGEVEEALLSENKIDSWRIRVAREMANQLNGARGVIIPHQFVKAVGDVFVVSAGSLPTMSEESFHESSGEDSVDLTGDTINL